MSDARAFVTGITALDRLAKKKKLSIISGASTVPGLSSAVVEHFKNEFAKIDEMTFGISPGQKAKRGLATTQAILTYIGKPLKAFHGHKDTITYGWQDIYRQEYPKIGRRWMANCDVPDLDLLPERYDIKSIRFSAGLELGLLHLGLWGISWLIRLGLPINLPYFAQALLKASNWFNHMGSANGGMHVILKGKNHNGEPHIRKWFIIAFDGYGPHIPTIPAIILAKKLAHTENIPSGAMPCIGLVSLEVYLAELQEYPIKTYSE